MSAHEQRGRRRNTNHKRGAKSGKHGKAEGVVANERMVLYVSDAAIPDNTARRRRFCDEAMKAGRKHGNNI